jgi:hypothetical protein
MRLRAPSLARMFVTWRSTVFGESASRSAISRLLEPLATRRATSSSRALEKTDHAFDQAIARGHGHDRRAHGPRPVASAGSHQGFHVDKTCAEDCPSPSATSALSSTPTSSGSRPAPTSRYLSQADNVVQASIEIRNGSTDGACTWSSDVDAICVFSAGTGRLTQLNLEVVVTANADQSVWY